MERDNKPIDVKIAEGGKKLKLVEMFGGGVVAVFSPAAGILIIGFEGGQWLLINRYLDWRMGGTQQSQSTESKVIPCRQRIPQAVPQELEKAA